MPHVVLKEAAYRAHDLQTFIKRWHQNWCWYQKVHNGGVVGCAPLEIAIQEKQSSLNNWKAPTHITPPAAAAAAA
jgi:hypothetical protein